MGRVYRNSDHRSIPVGARFIRRKLKQTEQKTDSTQVDDHHIPYKLNLPAPCFQSSADVAFFSRAFVNSLSEVPWHCDSATKYVRSPTVALNCNSCFERTDYGL